MKFQSRVKTLYQKGSASRHTVTPPARQRPPAIWSATSENNGTFGCESASMNRSQSPLAARAPALRARAIWFTGSKTTMASAERASSAVRSVELLSHTISSLAQPRNVNAARAAFTLAREEAISFSSLKAGMTMEIFTNLDWTAKWPLHHEIKTSRLRDRANAGGRLPIVRACRATTLDRPPTAPHQGRDSRCCRWHVRLRRHWRLSRSEER